MLRSSFWPKKTFVFIILLATTLCLAGTDAEAKSRRTSTKHHKKHGLPVTRGDIYADLVIDAKTGRILHATNVAKLRHPASLTKMMTLYIAFQALESGKMRLDQPLAVSPHAACQSPSKLGLRSGQTIRAQDAIMGVVTESANDAAVVLAEALGGSESRFAQLMTRQAQALGMKNTVFQNASGLPDPDQVTTARDMAVLGHALIYHFPRHYSFFGNEKFTYAGRVHDNHNHLMERYEGMDGIKTGYVRASGFNLVASAVRGERRIIGVVFGGRSAVSRDNQMAQLLDQAFAVELTNGPVQKADANEAQGDGNDLIDSHYIALPAKSASMFLAPAQAQARAEEPEQKPSEEELKPRPAASNWGIQIGAYNDVASGQHTLASMSKDMSPLLSRAEPILQKIQTGEGTTIYRARFMGMEQATARSVCAYIVKKGHGCLVVAPEQTSGS